MEIQKYNKATKLLNNIEHIDKVIEFINGVKSSGLLIAMWETGFVAHPERVVLEEWEYDYIIATYENIKKMLEQELAEL